jgi:hypothetical protein
MAHSVAFGRAGLALQPPGPARYFKRTSLCFRFTAFGKREHVVAPELQRVDLALAVLAKHGGIPGSA